MKEKSNPTNNLTNKIRSSLVIKLNFKMIGRLFFSFLRINLLIVILSFFVILWNAETQVQNIIYIIDKAPRNFRPIYYNDSFEVLETNRYKDGFVLPQHIQQWLPVEIDDAKRSFIIEESKENMRLYERIDLFKYSIEVNLKDTNYAIIYSLGDSLRNFFYIFLVVLGFEILILLGNIRKGSKMIRKTLKPLAELTETAKSLQLEVASGGNKDFYIKDLAGKLSTIDADKLDREITVDSSQNELKELASAINDMLNRINCSYQAQVRFVSDASHELRTPISVIQGYVNLLDRWGKEDPKVMQESIEAIKSESENMKDLIEQLLFLARSDNETIQIHIETIDACDVVEETLRETKMIDVNHQIEVELNRPAYVNADKQLLKQALRILVDNSIKFTPPGKKITLKVNKEEEKVHIAVQDSGIGIESEDLPHLFDRFYRSDESRARETGGSGLGLSIAKWIVERHGAYFEIISRVNIGTRITMVFPEAKIEETIEVENKAVDIEEKI